MIDGSLICSFSCMAALPIHGNIRYTEYLSGPNIYIYIYIYIYAPPWRLSSLAKELPSAASVMQSSSKELSTLVADRV